MSVTITSRIAYKDINESGVSKNQKEVIYETVANNCDADVFNLGISLKEISRRTGIEINAVSGRVNDLKKDNRLETIEKRKCTITHKLISPVIVKIVDPHIDDDWQEPEDAIIAMSPNEHKAKLILKIAGYNIKAAYSTRYNYRYFFLGYWNPITKKALDQVHIKSDLRLEEVSVPRDSENKYSEKNHLDKYWYKILGPNKQKLQEWRG